MSGAKKSKTKQNSRHMIQEFDRIATDIRQILTNQPSHPNALELYGLYKQATVGDVNIGKQTKL